MKRINITSLSYIIALIGSICMLATIILSILVYGEFNGLATTLVVLSLLQSSFGLGMGMVAEYYDAINERNENLGGH